MIEKFGDQETLHGEDGYPMGAFRRRLPVESVSESSSPKVEAETIEINKPEIGLGLEISETVREAFRDSMESNNKWTRALLPRGYSPTGFSLEGLGDIDLESELIESLMSGLEADLAKKVNINKARIEVIVTSTLAKMIELGISESQATDSAAELKTKLERALNNLVALSQTRLKDLLRAA